MAIIKTVTVKQAKQQLKNLLALVGVQDHAVRIRRKHHPDAVLLSQTTYESLLAAQRTSLPGTHDELQQSIDQLTNQPSADEELPGGGRELNK